MTVTNGILNFVNKREIQDLVSRYILALDEKCFNNKIFETIFAAQAGVKLPSIDSACGDIDTIMNLHRTLLSQFESTHHMSSDLLVVFITSKEAAVRCNLSVIHRYNKVGKEKNGEEFLIVRDVLEGKVRQIGNKWYFFDVCIKVIYRQ
ncbi:nuclear transport factor 2 family protein [Pectinatus frisingensis]|uniref:nuclear transport factor 2 family protein n=1 Tax=Pectinatus frisingensis TaxID=865 RepID=UPI0018C70996|nr:nuclear transport factor 2 family protein [Pectinatus frisingensis]